MIQVANNNLLRLATTADPQKGQLLQGLLSNKAAESMAQNAEQAGQEAANAANQFQAMQEQQMMSAQQQASQAMEQEKAKKRMALQLGIMAATGGFGGGAEAGAAEPATAAAGVTSAVRPFNFIKGWSY